jgi:hypothetical protein
MKIGDIKFSVSLTFYEDEKSVSFSDIPKSIQSKFNKILSLSTPKFKKYIESNISNMGSVCKNQVSHYLDLKIKNITTEKTESFMGLFGNSMSIEIFGTVNKVNKKVVGEMWCKKISDSEVKKLFSEDNLSKHIDYSLKELGRGEPFSKITNNKKSYSFRFGDSKIIFMTQ